MSRANGRHTCLFGWVVIETVEVSALVDTGSPRSVISTATLKHIIQDHLSEAGRQRIEASSHPYRGPLCRDVQGNELPIQKCVTLSVRIRDDEIILAFLVVAAERLRATVLLGTDALKNFKAELQTGKGNTTRLVFREGGAGRSEGGIHWRGTQRFLSGNVAENWTTTDQGGRGETVHLHGRRDRAVGQDRPGDAAEGENDSTRVHRLLRN